MRRARTKYVKLHRRRGAAQVRGDRSRTRAAAAIERTATKAEAFEDALNRVSTRLAAVAAGAAEAIKQERLAAAAAVKGSPTSRRTAGTGASRPAAAPRARERTPAERKRDASTRATTGRAQARRDSP